MKVITFVIPSHLTYELLRKHREKFSKASDFIFSVILSWRCWNPRTSNFKLVCTCFVGCFCSEQKRSFFVTTRTLNIVNVSFSPGQIYSKKKLAWWITESFKDDTWLKGRFFSLEYWNHVHIIYTIATNPALSNSSELTSFKSAPKLYNSRIRFRPRGSH